MTGLVAGIDLGEGMAGVNQAAAELGALARWAKVLGRTLEQGLHCRGGKLGIVLKQQSCSPADERCRH